MRHLNRTVAAPLRWPLLLFFCSALVLSGCKKEEEESGGEEPSSNQSAADEAEIAEFETWNDHQKALRLGEKLGLSVLGHSAGAKGPSEGIREKAQILADQLGVGELPAFEPLTGEQSKDDAAALHYILELSQPVEEKLAAKSPELGALFRMSIRLQILMLLFLPGDMDEPKSLTKSALMGAIHAGMKAGLDENYLGKELRGIGNAPSHDAMKDRLTFFLNDVFDKLEDPSTLTPNKVFEAKKPLSEEEVVAYEKEVEGWTPEQKSFELGTLVAAAALDNANWGPTPPRGMKEKMEVLSGQLGVKVPEMVKLTGVQKDDDMATIRFIRDGTEPLGKALKKKHSKKAAAALFMGLQLESLKVVFKPNDTAKDSLTMKTVLDVSEAAFVIGMTEDFMLETVMPIVNAPSMDAAREQVDAAKKALMAKLGS